MKFSRLLSIFLKVTCGYYDKYHTGGIPHTVLFFMLELQTSKSELIFQIPSNQGNVSISRIIHLTSQKCDVQYANNSGMHLQSLWSELCWDGLYFKKKKKGRKREEENLSCSQKNSDKKSKTTRLTFLYNYSSDQSAGGVKRHWWSCGALHCNLDLSIQNNNQFSILQIWATQQKGWKKGTHGSLQRTEGTRQNILWCDLTIPEPFSNATKHFIWQNQHHPNCEMRRQPHARRTIWAQRAKFLRTAGSLKLFFHIKCVDSNKTLKAKTTKEQLHNKKHSPGLERSHDFNLKQKKKKREKNL